MLLNLVIDNGGKTIVTIFTGAVVLMFVAFLIVFLVLDYKNTKISEIKKRLYNSVEKREKYEVTTVYSDKSKNYSGTEILPIPSKEPTEEYNFEFLGWDKNYFNESGDTVAKPVYLKRLNKFIVNFYLDDKTTLLKSIEVEYGKSADASDLLPKKNETDEFAFEFDGWSKDISKITQNESVYVVFKATPKKCTYKFVDSDGSVLFEETTIFGTPIFYKDEPISKDSSKVFSHFENYVSGKKLEKDEVFVAVYKSKFETDLKNAENKENIGGDSNLDEIAQNDKTEKNEDNFENNQAEVSGESVQNENGDAVEENLVEEVVESNVTLENDEEKVENLKNQNETEKIETNQDKKESYFKKDFNANFTFFNSGFADVENDEIVEEIGSKPKYLKKNDSNIEQESKTNNDSRKGNGNLFNMNFAGQSNSAKSQTLNKTIGGQRFNSFSGLAGASSNLNVDGNNNLQNSKIESGSRFSYGKQGNGFVTNLNFGEMKSSENAERTEKQNSESSSLANSKTIKKVKDGVTIEYSKSALPKHSQELAEEKNIPLQGFEKLRNNSPSSSQKIVYSNFKKNNVSVKSNENSKVEDNSNVLNNRHFGNVTRLNNLSDLFEKEDSSKNKKEENVENLSKKNNLKNKGTFGIFTGENFEKKEENQSENLSFGSNATMRKNYFTGTKIANNSFKDNNFEAKTQNKENLSNHFEAVNFNAQRKSDEAEKNENNNLKTEKIEVAKNTNIDEEIAKDEGSPLPRISVAGARLRTERARQENLKSNQQNNQNVNESNKDDDVLFGTILINHRKKK